MMSAEAGAPVDRPGMLDRALRVFWTKGYKGASLEDLTQAMGINRPSLYAAFGNKEELFRRALDRYAEKGPGAVHRRPVTMIASSLRRGGKQVR
jgi:AcrR family transcriptional regulator